MTNKYNQLKETQFIRLERFLLSEIENFFGSVNDATSLKVVAVTAQMYCSDVEGGSFSIYSGIKPVNRVDSEVKINAILKEALQSLEKMIQKECKAKETSPLDRKQVEIFDSLGKHVNEMIYLIEDYSAEEMDEIDGNTKKHIDSFKERFYPSFRLLSVDLLKDRKEMVRISSNK
jgi:hypothetical protein